MKKKTEDTSVTLTQKITITAGEQKLVLDARQAEEVYRQLKTALNKPDLKPVVVREPYFVPYEKPRVWWESPGWYGGTSTKTIPPYTLTCGNTTDTLKLEA